MGAIQYGAAMPRLIGNAEAERPVTQTITCDRTYQTVIEQIVNVLPHLSKQQIDPRMRLKDIGADSVARADIYALSMDALGLDLPLVDLARAADIAELVELLHSRVGAARAP
jgi:polyketide biosynthesis acyl carrier protein